MRSQNKKKGEAGIGTTGRKRNILINSLYSGAISLTTKVASILAPNHEGVIRRIGRS